MKPRPPSVRVPWQATPVPWRDAARVELAPVTGSPAGPPTAVRLRAGPGGLEVRFTCRASRITADMANDGDPLYLQDVVEVFLHPDQDHPGQYLEYEVSPLGRDLTLLCCRQGGACTRWRPWGVAPADRPACRVRVTGGPQEPGAAIRRWQADLRLPWTALAGIAPPPVPGSRWRANFYRIDRAGGDSHQAWSDPGAAEFHRLAAFGTLVFDASTTPLNQDLRP